MLRSQQVKFDRLLGLGCVLLGLVIGANGCARRYNVILTNGNVLTALGKPKFDKATGAYTFKDSRGQQVSIPGFRVKEIAPPGLEEKSEFDSMPPTTRKR